MKPQYRFITASALFDGHDVSINLMRRLLQQAGHEVIHLGHNRSVDAVVSAALQEDAHAIAISSYQGGHCEYFTYLADKLAEANASHIAIFGGGGGVITAKEIAQLESKGICKIYHAEDGKRLGLTGLIEDMETRLGNYHRPTLAHFPDCGNSALTFGQLLSAVERGTEINAPTDAGVESKSPIILGVTGPGGSGKSSLSDELCLRFLHNFPQLKIAVLANDPTRRKTGGALLGDRIRFNSAENPRLFFRSLATSRPHATTHQQLKKVIELCSQLDFDLILVETAGTGQSDSEIVDWVDCAIYVMTSEYGAPTQLEKIDMLDFAHLIVLNKCERAGSQDAARDIRKQWRRNHNQFACTDDEIPFFSTRANLVNDAGVNQLFAYLCQHMKQIENRRWQPHPLPALSDATTRSVEFIPNSRAAYLSDIAANGRAIKQQIEAQVQIAAQAYGVFQTLQLLLKEKLQPFEPVTLKTTSALSSTAEEVYTLYRELLSQLSSESIALLKQWPEVKAARENPNYHYQVRDRTFQGDNYTRSLSETLIPKVALPQSPNWEQQLRYLLTENVPGEFPFTAGVFPYRHAEESPTRMFAGEGGPERTNKRFHLLAAKNQATRLSTAFDSVTLYGENPHRRPDIYGKIGNAGVSIATLDDMKKLYSGFDLTAPSTSVSMTINGPAPIILAMFLNTAIDQNIEKQLRATGELETALAHIARPDCQYPGDLPEGHSGLGLATLGIAGRKLVPRQTYEKIKADTLQHIRGTVQADILKEDQAQNTCIFSTEFSLKLMGDVQEYFTEHSVNRFYSASVSGYHIAEAGANPITQLAFTLANGFTYVEYFLARGLKIDDFAPNLSFFFSNGLDAEYAVIGRVARRIWARAMRDRYGANSRSQKLKYHIQTSGRSLHAQEIQFNDIRTTLQALYAIYDNCNSLHTNAYDEAITTPTESSVRRALAIQMIINQEFGLNQNQNSLQGAYIIEQLTDLVEEAVYAEFDRLSARGGVLGAMETMYQRSQIQQESMHYEQKKHDGSLAIIGVNTFLSSHDDQESLHNLEVIRSTEDEKQRQIEALKNFQSQHQDEAPQALQELSDLTLNNGNIFEKLLQTVEVCSLGEITHTLYQLGGRYRRAM